MDMTDSMGPGKLVRHMQNPLYTYDEYWICMGGGGGGNEGVYGGGG